MLPGFRFLFAAIVLSMSILVFGSAPQPCCAPHMKNLPTFRRDARRPSRFLPG